MLILAYFNHFCQWYDSYNIDNYETTYGNEDYVHHQLSSLSETNSNLVDFGL